MIHDFCRKLYQLIRLWWTGDRIRVSPVEGRLLRIQPGDLLSVAGIEVEVIDRFLIAESYLCLICHTPQGTAELHVPVFSQAAPQEVLWIESGDERRLTAADVEVWPRGRRGSRLSQSGSVARHESSKGVGFRPHS
jgi:hypothetical protein